MNKVCLGRTLGVLAFATLVAACGESTAPAETTVAATAGRPANDFTAAVPLGAVGAAARLQFQVANRPVVGKPVSIMFKAVPTSAVQKIQIVFEAEPGLGFVDELRATVLLEGAGADTAAPHELQVLPSAEGVLLLKATVVTETEAGSESTEFAIPLLVSADQPVRAAPAAAPAQGG
jgi:hypothetical protein